MNGKTVVVGLSGGVDSSVTAYLLQKEGYNVIGMFMRNWHDEEVTLSNDCPWLDDSNDALMVAETLGIPFQTIDLSKEYKERIVDYMFSEYAVGRTPNPDVLCNREIKFDVFLKAAVELGADYVATGHYCRKIIHENGEHGLLAGLDNNKNQSYFLCQLSQEQLQKAIFPIGNYQKSEVRELAKEAGIHISDKKDSQGLCFVGKIRLPQFLQQQLKSKQGKVLEIQDNLQMYTDYKTFYDYDNLQKSIDNLQSLTEPFIYSDKIGLEVATHQGAHFYTIGQRKGLQVGGRPEPSFVIGIDTVNNLVYTGQTDEHPGLNRIALKILNEDVHYILKSKTLKIGEELRIQARIRYRQELQDAWLIQKEEAMYVLFDKLQKGITPGQFCAWYVGDELIGSGTIFS